MFVSDTSEPDRGEELAGGVRLGWREAAAVVIQATDAETKTEDRVRQREEGRSN